MPKLAAYTPYARYALIILATKMVSGGFLPPELVDSVAADPLLVEFAAGILLYLGTGVWYFWSKARKALDDALA